MGAGASAAENGDDDFVPVFVADLERADDTRLSKETVMEYAGRHFDEKKWQEVSDAENASISASQFLELRTQHEKQACARARERSRVSGDERFVSRWAFNMLCARCAQFSAPLVSTKYGTRMKEIFTEKQLNAYGQKDYIANSLVQCAAYVVRQEHGDALWGVLEEACDPKLLLNENACIRDASHAVLALVSHLVTYKPVAGTVPVTTSAADQDTPNWPKPLEFCQWATTPELVKTQIPTLEAQISAYSEAIRGLPSGPEYDETRSEMEVNQVQPLRNQLEAVKEWLKKAQDIAVELAVKAKEKEGDCSAGGEKTRKMDAKSDDLLGKLKDIVNPYMSKGITPLRGIVDDLVNSGDFAMLGRVGISSEDVIWPLRQDDPRVLGENPEFLRLASYFREASKTMQWGNEVFPFDESLLPYLHTTRPTVENLAKRMQAIGGGLPVEPFTFWLIERAHKTLPLFEQKIRGIISKKGIQVLVAPIKKVQRVHDKRKSDYVGCFCFFFHFLFPHFVFYRTKLQSQRQPWWQIYCAAHLCATRPRCYWKRGKR